MLTPSDAFTDQPQKRPTEPIDAGHDAETALHNAEDIVRRAGQSESHGEQDSSPQDPPADRDQQQQEDEESIEEYMAKLMDRVSTSPKNGSRAPTTRWTPPSRAASTAKAGADSSSAAGPSAAEGTSAGDDDNPDQATGPHVDRARTAPPEKSSVMTTMRAVANQSAQMAVDIHTRRQLVQSAYWKLVATNFFLGLACLLLVWPPAEVSWAYTAAWVLLAWAMWMFWWYNVSVGLLSEAWATDRRAFPTAAPSARPPSASLPPAQAPAPEAPTDRGDPPPDDRSDLPESDVPFEADRKASENDD